MRFEGNEVGGDGLVERVAENGGDVQVMCCEGLELPEGVEDDKAEEDSCDGSVATESSRRGHGSLLVHGDGDGDDEWVSSGGGCRE